ncbi:MAG: AAA family ATPase [Bacteroidales bacterium]
MFKEVDIKNFRGIRDCHLGDLKQINLFFGKNNCGKSSVLEAIFLLSGYSNPLLPLNINFWRDYTKRDYKDILLDFYQLKRENTIEISAKAENEERFMSITTFESNSKTVDIDQITETTNNINESSYGFSIKFGPKKEKPFQAQLIFGAENDRTQMTPKKVKVKQDNRYKEQLVSKILLPRYQLDNSITELKDIIADKKENLIIEVLRNIDSRVKDIVLIDDTIMVDIGLESRVPVNMMGDGMRKILAILVSIIKCENGILFIDEIDNGLHYTSMQTLWASVIRSAKTFNVQLFISTHNIDSLKALQQIFEKEEFKTEQQNMAAFKLIRMQNDELKSVAYDFTKFEYAIHQEIEMR